MDFVPHRVDGNPGQPLRRTLVRAAVLALVIGAAYFCVDFVLNKVFSDGWTILWPLNGITIALLLTRQRSDWIPILVGNAIGMGIGEYLDNNPVSLLLLLRFCSLAEVTISALILPPFSTLEQWLRRPYLFTKFWVALLLGPGISGLMAAYFLHLFQGQGFLLAFDNWAISDALGIAAIMPLALSLRTHEMRGLFTWSALPKTVGLLALAYAVAALCFSVDHYSLIFLVYPALLLVDSILAFSGSAIAVTGVSLLAVYLTVHHRGPFGTWSPDLPLSGDIALQAFLGFQVLALFPASILFMERRRLAEDLRDTNAQLLMLASIDGLTGIANRRSLDDRFAQEWLRGLRLGTPLGLVMIDVDHFKQFNDLYGHLAGDECLHAVASAIADHVRRAQDHAARYGGEEFALLLPHTELFGAHLIAEKIREAIFNLGIPHRGSPWGRVTVSVGYTSQVPAFASDRSELVQLADAALYGAKRSGRNRVSARSASEQKVL